MPIRDIDAYARAAWQWNTVLNGCFGTTTIEPSDIDGIVERNGHFLVLEAKSSRARMSRGQEIMLRRLANLDNFTIIVIWGKKHKPEKLLVITKEGEKTYENINVGKLRHIVIEWWLKADGSNRNGAKR